MKNNQNPLREELQRALTISLSDLEAAVDQLNQHIKSAVPTPPQLTPPHPKMLAPGWIIGLRRYQAPALAIEFHHKTDSWLSAVAGADLDKQISSHAPRVHAYRVCLLHAIPHLPAPRDWQALVDGKMEYDAIGARYSTKSYSEFLCCSLNWNPVHLRRVIKIIQSLTAWCYRMIEHIDHWCRRQLDQPEAAEALQFLRDILVEHTIREGKL